MSNGKKGHAVIEAKKLLCCGIDAAESQAVGGTLDALFEMANDGRGGPMEGIDGDEERREIVMRALAKVEASSAAKREAKACLVELQETYARQQGL